MEIRGCDWLGYCTASRTNHTHKASHYQARFRFLEAGKRNIILHDNRKYRLRCLLRQWQPFQHRALLRHNQITRSPRCLLTTTTTTTWPNPAMKTAWRVRRPDLLSQTALTQTSHGLAKSHCRKSITLSMQQGTLFMLKSSIQQVQIHITRIWIYIIRLPCGHRVQVG